MGVREIPLTKGRVALVDVDDFEWLSRFRWVVNPQGYAITKTAPYLRMHRLIMGLPRGEVDHKNRDRLDNRKENLRRATHAENCANRPSRSATGFKGVSKTTLNRTAPYRAAIRRDGKHRSLGFFETPEEAARAYDRAAAEIWGDFAFLNFPAAA